MADSTRDDEPFRLSPIAKRVINSSAAIEVDDVDSITFQHTVLCQTSLPYKRVPDREWLRTNGNILLLVEAGKAIAKDGKTFENVPLPYGSRARLVLTHLNREAMRQRSPIIEVDDSLTRFTKRIINRPPNSRDLTALKQQLRSLSVATVRLGMTTHNHQLQINTQIVKKFDLWAPKDPRQKTLWPSTVQLNQEYYESLSEHAVPLNERAIQALQYSGLALDIYAWLAQRLHRIPEGRGQFIGWAALREQFGSAYKRLRSFRDYFRPQLRAVLTQYPQARVEVEGTAGIRLRHSSPPVQRRLISGPGTTLDALEAPIDL